MFFFAGGNSVLVKLPLLNGKSLELVSELEVEVFALPLGRKLVRDIHLPLGPLENKQKRNEQSQSQPQHCFGFFLADALFRVAPVLPNYV
jgi:hypothetical protein